MSPPLISKYFSEIFSPTHIKLTNNNPQKDVQSVERPYEVEKFKLDRKILSRLRIRKSWWAGFERMTLIELLSNLIHYTTRSFSCECMEYL